MTTKAMCMVKKCGEGYGGLLTTIWAFIRFVIKDLGVIGCTIAISYFIIAAITILVYSAEPAFLGIFLFFPLLFPFILYPFYKAFTECYIDWRG